MKHARSTRHDFTAAYPSVFCETEIDWYVHIIDNPSSVYSLWGNLNNKVRFAKSPFGVGPSKGCQRIFVALDNRAVIDPMNEFLHLLIAEIHFVFDLVAHFVVDLTRWHTLGHDHFANHW